MTDKLLNYHMNCNPSYRRSHAKMIQALMNGECPDYKSYENKADSLGVTSYTEEVFNTFQQPTKKNYMPI